MPWNRAWDDSSPNCAQRMYSVGSGGSMLSGFQKPPMSWLHMLMPERVRLTPEPTTAPIPPAPGLHPRVPPDVRVPPQPQLEAAPRQPAHEPLRVRERLLVPHEVAAVAHTRPALLEPARVHVHDVGGDAQLPQPLHDSLHLLAVAVHAAGEPGPERPQRRHGRPPRQLRVALDHLLGPRAGGGEGAQ